MLNIQDYVNFKELLNYMEDVKIFQELRKCKIITWIQLSGRARADKELDNDLTSHILRTG